MITIFEFILLALAIICLILTPIAHIIEILSIKED